jgi:hypothetical protein
MQDSSVIVQVTRSGEIVRPIGRPTLEAICCGGPTFEYEWFPRVSHRAI